MMKRSTLEQFAEDEQSALFKKSPLPEIERPDKFTIILQRKKMGWEARYSDSETSLGIGQDPMEALKNLIEPAAWDDFEREHRKMGGGPIPQPEMPEPPKPPW